MKHAKFLLVTAITAVLGLVGAACSSDSSDSNPATTATAAAVATSGASAPPETAIATTAAAGNVVEEQSLPSASEAETTPAATASTAVSTTTTTTDSPVPSEASETPSTASTSATTTTTTTTSVALQTTTTTSTTASVPSVEDLRVQVLNGSGIAGAAGRLTESLEEAGWDMLPASNAPRRYAASAVYYSHGVLEEQAEEIAVATGVGGVVSLRMPSPAPFAVEGADVYVVVLIGADDLGGSLRPPERTSSLRPRQRNDVLLPLPDSVPRDRYVPGLANVNIYTAENENDPQVFLYTDTLARALGSLGTFADERWSPVSPRAIEARTTEKYQTAIEAIEQNLEWLGFTPQNTCGAPAGYSFTGLLQPTREWDDNLKTYGGDAIFITDRLIELHGGARINPEANLDFYIRQAAQTAHDALRITELAAETEAVQLILCRALLAPSGEVPELANSLWYANLTPGIRPRESLLSQGTYHVKEISRNGNMAYVLACHPTLGSRYVDLAWRDAGYRAEVVGTLRNNGCQENFERRGYIADYEPEETIRFSFGEHIFSASDLQGFPRN